MSRLIFLLPLTLLAAGCDRQKANEPQASNGAEASLPGEIKGVDRSRAGQAAPAAAFNDPEGKASSLAALAGKPVLVNLWASWCAPCVKELPTLQAVAERGQLAVIAVSQDMAPKASVDAFLKEKAIGRFAAWHDPEMALSTALEVQVMPTTILYGADGKEIWRYTGDLDWTGPEATKLLSEAG